MNDFGRIHRIGRVERDLAATLRPADRPLDGQRVFARPRIVGAVGIYRTGKHQKLNIRARQFGKRFDEGQRVHRENRERPLPAHNILQQGRCSVERIHQAEVGVRRFAFELDRRAKVVLKVATDPRQYVSGFDAVFGQRLRITNPGQHQQLWRLIGPGGEHRVQP
ncbi:hypothetical protein D3C71_1535880 [compost metagenome]